MNRKEQLILEKIATDQQFRIELCKKDHYYFFHIYQSENVTCETAPFHQELFDITEDESIEMAVIAAFRGSGKSTIMCHSYPIWAMIGDPSRKFIVIISQTERQAQLHLQYIKRQLESNELLIRDFGPFYEDASEWQRGSLVIPKYDTRIMAFSTEGNARGILHGATRPDLIICDDIESLQSVKTQDGRDKTSEWLFGDVIPMGVRDVKVVIIGNYLHDDCLIARLKAEILSDQRDGIYREYPIYDENKRTLWPAMFSDMAAVEKKERKINNAAAFAREYLLKIISTEEQIIKPEMIHYYDQLPKFEDVNFVAFGVDLAISKNDTADFTAILTAYVTGNGLDTRIYILPTMINKRLSFSETTETILQLIDDYRDRKRYFVYVEDVAYQHSAIEDLERKLINVEGVSIGGQDKLARLNLAEQFVKSGHVLFPKNNSNVLVQQLVGFGSEKYDDMADAFSLLVNRLGVDIRKRHSLAELNKTTNDPRYMPLTAGLMDKVF